MVTTLPGGINFMAGVGLLLRLDQTINPFLPSLPAILMTVDPTEFLDGKQIVDLRGGNGLGVEIENDDEGGALS